MDGFRILVFTNAAADERAIEALGVDLAYLGTRLIGARESLASDE